VSAAPEAPQDLPNQVMQMITRMAGIALRAHDELMLPDATGTPVTLKSLFHAPRDLMAAPVRGGWVIPGAAGPQHVPDRDHRHRPDGGQAVRGRCPIADGLG